MKNLEYIERYFDNELSENEKEAFNLKIQTDESFAKEVAFYLKSKELAKIEQKNRFSALNQDLRQKKSSKNIFLMGGSFAAAASIIIAFFLLFQSDDFSSQQYASNYVKDNLASISTQMSSDKSSLSEGVELYNQHKYQEALLVFQKTTPTPQTTEYQGLCYLQLKEYDKALSQFQELSGNKDLLQNKGDFYQAITLMQKGEEVKAKSLLTKIANNTENVFGKAEAKKILEEWK